MGAHTFVHQVAPFGLVRGDLRHELLRERGECLVERSAELLLRQHATFVLEWGE